jgi:flavin-binding protein dodecin
MTTATKTIAQAWIELRATDPEASSAFAIARADLEAGRTLESLRRFRVFELRGELPDAAGIAELLHRSIQFYNPSKERCVVRAAEGDAAPVRDGERRTAAERWWKHETGEKVEVREGIAWALKFAPGADAAALAADLAVARDRSHGLLSNPHAQEWRPGRMEGSSSIPPLEWIGSKAAAVHRGRTGGAR